MSEERRKTMTTERRDVLANKLRDKQMGEAAIAQTLGDVRGELTEREVAQRIVAWARQLRKKGA
jgi:hypothetical protein